MRVRFSAVFGLFLGLMGMASARVGTVTTDQLAKSSKLILTARVEKIFDRANVKVASATVLTLIKGNYSAKTVEFVACRTWTCDSSSAVAGETVLLFLNPCPTRGRLSMLKQDLEKASELSASQGLTLFEIAHSGRGRVPLTVRGPELTAEVERYSSEDSWNLSVNHALAKGCSVRLTGENKGVVSFVDLLRVVKKSLS